MKIIKILNHNAVLIHQIDHDLMLLALHPGIGFGRKINERITLPQGAKSYLLKKTNSKGQTSAMVHALDPLYIEISSKILELTKEAFGTIDENILLPLADHIAFAVKRINESLDIKNPFTNEIKLLYPEAYALAIKSLPIIKETLGIDIHEDELGYIALHIHASSKQTNHDGMVVAVILNESIQEIGRQFNKTIDVNSLSYSRLMVHMKYLLARLIEGEVLSLDMESYAQEKMPRSYEIAKRIIERIEVALGLKVPHVETGYLAVHIERILN